jgi:zinc transport system substrate-binding protein
VFFFITRIDFDFRPNQVIDVYTTNYPLKFMIEQLGDDSVRVKSIYETFEPISETIEGENGLEMEVINFDYIPTNSREYVLDQETAEEIITSDLFLYSGYNLEIKYLSLLLSIDGVDKLDIRDASLKIQKYDYNNYEEVEIQVVKEQDGVPITYSIIMNDYYYSDMKFNPNIWHDPINMLQMAVTTRDILKEKLPTKVEIIDENFAEYKKDILRYDSKLQDVIDSGRNKLIIVDRPFLAHMQRYGLEQIAFADMFNTSIITEKDFGEIYRIMQYYGIEYLVTDDTSDMSPMFEQFATAYGYEVITIHNLDILPKDDYENGESYFTILNRDLEALEKVLK